MKEPKEVPGGGIEARPPDNPLERLRAQIGRVKMALLREDSQRAETLFRAASGLCIAAANLIRHLPFTEEPVTEEVASRAARRDAQEEAIEQKQPISFDSDSERISVCRVYERLRVVVAEWRDLARRGAVGGNRLGTIRCQMLTRLADDLSTEVALLESSSALFNSSIQSDSESKSISEPAAVPRREAPLDHPIWILCNQIDERFRSLRGATNLDFVRETASAALWLTAEIRGHVQKLADVDAALASLRQELEQSEQARAAVHRVANEYEQRIRAAEALLLQRTQERDLKLADQQVVYEQLREAQAAGETLRARLREMVAAWTTEAARIETFHATMSTGYRACAEQLAALLADETR